MQKMKTGERPPYTGTFIELKKDPESAVFVPESAVFRAYDLEVSKFFRIFAVSIKTHSNARFCPKMTVKTFAPRRTEHSSAPNRA